MLSPEEKRGGKKEGEGSARFSRDISLFLTYPSRGVKRKKKAEPSDAADNVLDLPQKKKKKNRGPVTLRLRDLPSKKKKRTGAIARPSTNTGRRRGRRVR